MDLAEASILALRLALALGLYAFLFAIVRAASGWLTTESDSAVSVVATAAAVSAVIRLQLLDGADGGSVDLRPGDTLGRSPSVTYRLDNPTVSGTHARVESDRSGWRIADLGSTNGTRVNEERVEGVAVLSAGDIVALGDVRLRVL